MNGIDLAILRALQVHPDANSELDSLVWLASSNYILKGVFVVMLCWALWFSHPSNPKLRSQLVAVAAISILAIVLGRVLAKVLPFRLRPRYEPLIPDNPFADTAGASLMEWSSMPSDHALLYFAFATGLFLISRPIGYIALLHALLIIALPRVALWFHYPSDILAGAAIGAALALALFQPVTRLTERVGVVRWFETQPALMYPLMFLASFQIASNFESLRLLLSALFTRLFSLQ